MNSIKVHLPESLGTLSAADLAKIAQNHGSPYTEDYNLVMAPLAPLTVQASLLEFAADTLAPLKALMQHEGISADQLSLRQIADAIYGRPPTDPGSSSDFDILEPLMDTDTKSYNDFKNICRFASWVTLYTHTSFLYICFESHLIRVGTAAHIRGQTVLSRWAWAMARA